MNISDWIVRTATQSPDKLAIRFKERAISYGRFDDQIARIAGALADELGVRSGDRVAFLGENSPEMLQILFACGRLGAIFVPLNARMTAEQLRVFLGHFQPCCMLAETGFQDTAAESLAGLRGVPLVLFTVPAGPRETLQSLAAIFAAARRRTTVVDHADKRPVVMFYTSGTTGDPKGVLQTHENFFYNAMNAAAAYEMTQWDEVLTVASISHAGGLNVHTMPSFFLGATVTLHEAFDATLALRDIERYRITVFSARPYISKLITDHPNWDATDLSSLRTVNCGSTRVPRSCMIPWFERGVTVQHAYGLTEGLPPVTAVPIKDAFRKIGSIGKPMPHFQLRIVDADLRDVEPGYRGQIILRGGAVFEGYWRNPRATEETLRDGWLLTGDVGHADDEGFLYFDGRIKDIIIVNSSNIYPADVERILAECDAIKEATVIGQPDPDTGEAVVAFVVLKNGHALTAEDVKELFVGRLAPYQYPRHVRFLDALPYNLAGKVRKAALRHMLTA